MDVISTNASLRRYGREFLLQLRMHPCSLQKPTSLKDHEVVKDKLNLHQMENYFVSNTDSLSELRSAYPPTIKHDTEMMFRSHRTLSELFPRTCPLYTANYKSNSGYHGMPSSKTRPFYSMSDSMPPFRKRPIVPSPDYKYDLMEHNFTPNWTSSKTTVPWSKRSSYEELWNSYTKTLQKNGPKDLREAPVKCKKTLQIIDPSNGKNILDGIISSTGTSQKSIVSEENESDQKDKESSSGLDELANDKPGGDDGLETQSVGCETQSVESTQEMFVPQVPEHTTQDLKTIEELCELGEVQCEENIVHKNGLDNYKKESVESSSLTDLPSTEKTNDYEKYFSYSSSEDLAAVNVKSKDNLKGTEIYNIYQLPQNNRNTFPSRDNALRTEAQLKANIRMLKEELYSMRQEQQKMVIYQRFLRYKKHQLDEMFRSLDDQKNEIADWEYNLAGKEKWLKDKEAWFEVKRRNKWEELRERERNLKSKEDELREREKKLGDGNLVKYTNGIDDGKLNKNHREFDAWKVGKGPNEVDTWNLAEEFGARKFPKYSDVVVGRKLAKDQNRSGESGDGKVENDGIKIHFGQLAHLNEFETWPKDAYKMDADKLDKDLEEIEGVRFVEVSNKDGALNTKEIDLKENVNGFENFHENGIDYPEVNGDYPMDM